MHSLNSVEEESYDQKTDAKLCENPLIASSQSFHSPFSVRERGVQVNKRDWKKNIYQ